MDQHSTRAALESARDRFFLAGAAYALLTGEASKHHIVDYDFSLSEAGFQVHPHGSKGPPGNSRTISFNRAAAEDEAHALLDSAFQKLITDSVDAVKSFAQSNGDWNILKRQPWFAFSSHLRNAFSHNGRWRFEKHAIVPVRWKSYEIDRRMDGHSARDFISYFEATDLQAQMIIYVVGAVDCRQHPTKQDLGPTVNPLL